MKAPPGFDAERLGYLSAAVEPDMAARLYFDGVISIQRGGQPVYPNACGYSNEAEQRAVALVSVFSRFAVTKAFTDVLISGRATGPVMCDDLGVDFERLEQPV